MKNKKNSRKAIEPSNKEVNALADKNQLQESQLSIPVDDIDVPVYPNSIEASIGYGSLLRELQYAYIERVAYYRSEVGGSLSIEEARAQAYHACKDEEEANRLWGLMMRMSTDAIDFNNLGELWSYDPKSAQAMWEMIKDEARQEFESGHLASKALVPVDYMRTAWNVASYLGVRESLIVDWTPHGGLELSLIDMLAQAFIQYQYWVKESILRTQTEPRREAEEYTEWKQWKRTEKEVKGWNPGWWDIPYVREQTAIEHTIQMADRWNRIYMRTLKNLRDLRRYSPPVIVNNGGQVNVAQQQVNVARQE
jgi:hypothetical protein